MFGRKRHERAGFALYTASVQVARNPYFYSELGVPDTMDGRFDMIGLYACLVIDRLRAEPSPGPELAQAVFDAMFSDMDHTLRELGVGDMSVGRKVRAMWEALHGRSEAYAAPLAAGDEPALAEALGRNVWRGTGPGRAAELLAGIVMRERDNLFAQAVPALLAGRVTFLSPERVAA
ncbi:MAG: ubiquinol-cytochrome C chaperone [Pseudomonadota bacterium]|nr:ubiquinol-cytochrome C chaperone [Pseudomonadota bacterium]